MSFEDLNNQEANVEKIKTPEGSYFVHGLKTWSAESSVGIHQPEISCSLQLDGKTEPIRPFGYILEIDRGVLFALLIETQQALSMKIMKKC